jgi:bacterial leucyl aminopeptidase
MDITDHRDYLRQLKAVNPVNVKYPTKPVLQSKVKPLLSQLKEEPMRENLEKFSGFYNRYYTSKYGKESADWLATKVQEYIEKAGADKFNVTVRKFNHQKQENYNSDMKAYEDGPAPSSKDRQKWIQNSIIATIPGQSSKTVIIGAHEDSTNKDYLDPVNAPAPGADDNGSGVVTILETLRVLLNDEDIKRGKAANTLEFHWYSAEEAGLLGSVDVFSKYKKEGRDVRAMFQQDMTGYIAKTLKNGQPEAFGLVIDPQKDKVNTPLTNFVKTVIQSYADIPFVETTCGYGCSDHASADYFGFPSAFVIESDMKDTADYIHTPLDTIEKLSFPHMVQHAKLTLGLAYELAFADLPKTKTTRNR